MMTERVEIVSDENVMSGDPCAAGTRIPPDTIVADLRAGPPIDEILAAYPHASSRRD
ncbi:DUF433 domain-containing protein [Methylobacterium fujisawaense]